MRNITLRDIKGQGGLLPPGIVRCNKTNPCQGIVFDNVNIDTWYNNLEFGYITEFAYGDTIDSYPKPALIKPGGALAPFIWKEHIINAILSTLFDLIAG